MGLLRRRLLAMTRVLRMVSYLILYPILASPRPTNKVDPQYAQCDFLLHGTRAEEIINLKRYAHVHKYSSFC